ncbi:hypothetical protein [Sphingobacterium sp. LRF_L2]|uniref:hypothetical protein n=1 Tax=Sphingobacterium sp. LRF_L2 TaxID=3369421 RepID=UPI003F610441
MKGLHFYLVFIGILFLISACQQGEKQRSLNKQSVNTKTAQVDSVNYTLIEASDEIPGRIDTTAITQLEPKIRALAAFYAALGGSSCDGEYCKLTLALGLGKQGSDIHKKLIKHYFPQDKVAETVVNQDCYLRPSGSSTFSDYAYLSITDFGHHVQVNYRLLQYNQGKEIWIEGPDNYLFEKGCFKKINRNLWTFVDQ